MSERRKAELCGEWQEACLQIGWSKDDLDWLVEMWLTFEGWRYAPNGYGRAT